MRRRSRGGAATRRISTWHGAATRPGRRQPEKIASPSTRPRNIRAAPPRRGHDPSPRDNPRRHLDVFETLSLDDNAVGDGAATALAAACANPHGLAAPRLAYLGLNRADVGRAGASALLSSLVDLGVAVEIGLEGNAGVSSAIRHEMRVQHALWMNMNAPAAGPRSSVVALPVVDLKVADEAGSRV